MALRLLEAHVPEDVADEARAALEECGALELWDEPGGAFGTVLRAVIGTGRTGAAMDLLHQRIANVAGLRVLVLPLDAVLPRPAASPVRKGRRERHSAAAVSREEVYANVSGGAELSRSYLVLAFLASLVAAIGLHQDSAAAVIGAMVVAPLLGPNMAVALGLTLGDLPLVRTAAKSLVAGFAVAMATAIAMGLVLMPDTSVREISSRTYVGLEDILLALAAGAAGTLAFTTGTASFLVGVMVAVALLPPTVAAGLLAAAGELELAFRALVLVACNVTAVMLAAMLTFLWQGMRPREWWEEERARRSARIGLAVSLALLLLLATGILVARRF